MRRLLLVALTAGLACAGRAAPPAAAWFEDVSARAGLAWRNVNGTPDQIALLDQNGQGIAVIDYDRDGDPDLFFPNGSTLDRWRAKRGGAPWALFRNEGGRFEDVTDSAGLAGDGWATGAAAADFDGDGWPDLFVAAYGATQLYRNQGDGTFARLPAAAGAEVSGWSSSAAFGDVDGDGVLDLAVALYVSFDPGAQPRTEADGKPCLYRGVPTGCGPWRWNGAGLRLFRGGGGRFVDATRASGVVAASDARGFQVVLADLDGDGDLDLYAGCDVMANAALANDGRGRFRADPSWGGLVSAEGKPESSMGLAVADLDGDGLPEIVTTNFAGEKNTLYANRPPPAAPRFLDVSKAAGLDRHPVELDWGAAVADFDHDGVQDLFHVNGHIYPQVAALRDPDDAYEQPPRLYAGAPGLEFDERVPLVPAARWCARALAIADLDGDGALDAVVGVHNGAPRVLANRVAARAGAASLSVELVGTRASREALGARVTLQQKAGRQVRLAAPHQGYQGTHDARLHFGLGAAGKVRPGVLIVRWPSGRATRHPVTRSGALRIVEP